LDADAEAGQVISVRGSGPAGGWLWIIVVAEIFEPVGELETVLTVTERYPFDGGRATTT
jgi:hypothetical protein